MQRLSDATAWQREYRQRLSSISWFMRCLKQRISQRANGEVGCSGHFWDARFLAVPLPHLGAVVGCMAYVDANPFRAKAVELPEQAAYASLRARLHPRGLEGSAEAAMAVQAAMAVHLTPLQRIAPVDPLSGRFDECALALEDYVRLVHAGCGLAPDLGPAAGTIGFDAKAWQKQVGAAGMFQALQK